MIDGNVNQPMERLDDWEESLHLRYPEPSGGKPSKTKEEFRNYEEASSTVREFYRLNHRFQTYDFVLAKEREYLPLRKTEMTVWEAMEFLNTLVDDSDPDTSLSQIEHLLQTSEAIRRDGHPRWFIFAGLVHDLGKVLCLFGEPQWAVVGDTFPVGCRFSEKIVFPEFFSENPDSSDPALSSPCGVYSEGCGLRNVHMSWGHDEYIYRVMKDRLPDEALYMLRYHSFYPAHREREYEHLMDDHDREMFEWVRKFNPFDLYSKGEEPPRVEALRPYYEDLIEEFAPGKLQW